MIKYNCGCGFRTTDSISAKLHVAQTQHTIQGLGLITYREVKTLQVLQVEEVRDEQS